MDKATAIVPRHEGGLRPAADQPVGLSDAELADNLAHDAEFREAVFESDKETDEAYFQRLSDLVVRKLSTCLRPGHRESSSRDSAIYNALWSLRHALQVKLHTPQGEALLLFRDDDYFIFEHAKVNWQRQSLRLLKDCLDQADRALTEIVAASTP